jgi:hypothetical protein
MYNMDNITIICESDAYEKIQMIMRQTDYNEDIAREKLMVNNDDPIKVIKEYMGIVEKPKPVPKSVNQEIYKQLRRRLDDSIRNFNIKQDAKLKDEIAMNNNRKID